MLLLINFIIIIIIIIIIFFTIVIIIIIVKNVFDIIISESSTLKLLQFLLKLPLTLWTE